MKIYYILLLFVPCAIIGRFLHLNDSMVFFAACIGIVPLAIIIGNSTEQIALYSGPKIGGMLNATMGNVPELLIGIFAIKAGLYDLVIASLAGSILGNILFVLGFSVFVGGLRFKHQTFNKNIARSNLLLLIFSAITIVIPYSFVRYAGTQSHGQLPNINGLTLSIAIMLILIYILGLIFSLITHRNLFIMHDENNDVEAEKPKQTLPVAVTILLITTAFVGVVSEILVATVEQAAEQMQMSEIFIGIILIPILGNVAEHASAVIMAAKNKIDLSIEIAVGSSMQIALFVAPILVLFSFILGKPMNYIYGNFEITGILAGTGLAVYIFQDGKTNWLEGAVLISCYCILALAFFFL